MAEASNLRKIDLFRSNSLVGPEPLVPSTSLMGSSVPKMPIDAEEHMQMRHIRMNSTVKINNEASSWSQVQPWQKQSNSWMGSGFIIHKRIIVTNAHVAEDAKILTFRKQSDGRRFSGRVMAIAEQVDLAFCTVDDEEFWENAMELSISNETVRFQDQVFVVGYPIGGDTVCITEGVVSRIDWLPYAQSGKSNLCIQVDAAINSGNSGGPCIFDGEVCGVAFEGMNNADGVGYIIPSSLLRRMVEELLSLMESKGVANLNYYKMKKFAEFPATFQFLENPYIRKYAKVPDNLTGVFINDVSKFGWLHKTLEVGDILTKVDDNHIGYDGKVSIPEMDGERIDFQLLISSKLVGESVRLEYVRAGKVVQVQVEILEGKEFVPLVPVDGCYYMFAGLVFVPLSMEIVFNNWDNYAVGIQQTLLHPRHLPRELEDQQRIVLSTTLPHDVNQCYNTELPYLPELKAVNNKRVYNMKGLVEAVQSLEEEKEEWIIFQFGNKTQIVFPLQDALTATKELMVDNNIVKPWDKIDNVKCQ